MKRGWEPRNCLPRTAKFQYGCSNAAAQQEIRADLGQD
ncbi:hypothetical protein MGWOODY_Smn126 [hydrothermal vent metagenome]|uniref:Uncharacterized protein n=1 Tax=hydrothermal vent metagenome TaxID=652676 RepID=A0A160TLU3_9ZZZZ